MQKTIASGISLPENLYKKIEELRGDVSRSRYVIRILENHFNEKFIFDKKRTN
jgi:hypothetical protein